MVTYPVSVFDVVPDYSIPVRIGPKPNRFKVRVQCRECGNQIMLDARIDNIYADHKCCVCDGASVTSSWK